MALRKELGELVRLALPASLAQLAIVGMSATDVLIVGRAGTHELAGMNLGVNIWNLIMMFFMGIGFATQPLIAKCIGANDFAGAKQQFHQCAWMVVALGAICTVSVLLGALALNALSIEAGIRSIAQSYLLIISLCALPITLVPAIRGTLEGMGLTVPVMLINFLAFLLNIPLDYIFVNGLYGFPAMGAVGSAWATVIVVCIMCLGNLWVLARHPKTISIRFLADFSRWQWSSIKRIFALGLPIGFSILVEVSMFAGAGLMIAYFGAIEVGAHAIAITIASASFMFYMGLGQGVTIRAAQKLGANDHAGAHYSIKVGTTANACLALLVALVFIAAPEFWTSLFSKDQQVLALAVSLLLFGAIFQLGDCIQVAAVCALRAYEDTVSPLKFQIASFWLVGLPLGVVLAFSNYWPQMNGAKGMWLAMTASLYLVAVLLVVRLKKVMRQTARETYQVIT